MYSVGAPHTWPQALGALMWNIDNVKVRNKYIFKNIITLRYCKTAITCIDAEQKLMCLLLCLFVHQIHWTLSKQAQPFGDFSDENDNIEEGTEYNKVLFLIFSLFYYCCCLFFL